MHLQDLPQPLFTWGIVGPTMCGKTHMLKEVLRIWLANKVFLEKNVHIFCPTEEIQNAYEEFTQAHIHDKPVAADVERIYNDAKTVVRDYGLERLPKILIIYDDCFSSDVQCNLMKATIAQELCTKGRHAMISQVFMSQQLNGIPKAVRLNSRYFSLFRPKAVLEVEDFLNQLVWQAERKAFKTACKFVWNAKDFAFVHLTDDRELSRQFRIGFDKPLFPSDDSSSKKRLREDSDSESEEVTNKDKKQKKVLE